MLREIRILILGLIFALALVPGSAVAQITTATVSGTVRDSLGAVVPGATVTLFSESRVRQVAETVTNATGDFVLANIDGDTYTIQVSLQGFKTYKATGIDVSPGDRVRLPAMVLQVGTLTETVQVVGETPLIQASSGERSFTIPTANVENLPISSRNFRDLALLTPGVIAGQNAGVMRIGGGGYANIQMDGISAMDTGNNGQMLQMNVDAVAEVKVLTSAYQAEYGRSSGIQVLSVTKSGTNRFRGTVYDVKRNSNWNKNSWYNTELGYSKTVSKQDDWGYTIGGPIGKPGGDNRLFFFHSIEFRPRTSGNSEQNFRVPTALERQGNFSQSRDNNGNLYPYIKDPLIPGLCTSANTAACFQYQGVVGWIPPDRLWAPGMALLNMYPKMPNFDQVYPYSYNVHQFSPVLKTLSYQPSVRVDYQVTSALRVAFKYNGHNQNSGIRENPGQVPGLTNTRNNQKPWITTTSVSANYNLGSKTFIEAIWGFTQNFYVTQPTGELSNRFTAKTDGIPLIYPGAVVVNPSYFTYKALSETVAPFFVNGNIELAPTVSFGSRTSSAQGLPSYPGWININRTWDLALSATHVMGRHTVKAGVGLNHSYKAQNMTQGVSPQGSLSFSESTNNPYDTSFGYANVAVGTFNSYSQASRFIESGMVYLGVEPYIQDNWKVNSRLTLDYGLRLVHLQPEHDKYMQASNFFPETWNAASAPTLYLPGCPGGINPCASSARQAMNPLTGQLLGRGTTGLIGQAVPGTGVVTNGIKQQGQGISKYNFEYPFIEFGPRVGVAYLLRPDGKLILRGGFGIFFDRVEGNYTMSQSANPPTAESTTMYYGQLQNLGTAGVSGKGVPQLVIYQYENKHLPSGAQWNIGSQMELPFAFTLDASYVGQYSYHTQGAQGGQQVTDLNMIDLGTAYLPQFQDPTLAPSSVPGQNAYTGNLMRYYVGFAGIRQNAAVFHRMSHGLQFSVQRRFARGFAAGLNWNWTLTDYGNYSGNYAMTQRIEHVNGLPQLRSDQKAWETLMKNQGTPSHYFKGNFVWDLPDLHAGSGIALTIVKQIINDWQLSGIWTAQTGGGYSIGYSYQNNGSSQNLTGSPDIGARIKINGNTGSGCSSNRYKQFNTEVFSGPTYYSDGLESGQNYMHACPTSVWDLAIARNIRVGGTRNIQIRAEMYNAFNQLYWTSRSTTVQYVSPTDQTIRNSQYLPDGTLDPNRLKANNAGFGAANNKNSTRSVQVQLRFSF